jgi:hypothetical protein
MTNPNMTASLVYSLVLFYDHILGVFTTAFLVYFSPDSPPTSRPNTNVLYQYRSTDSSASRALRLTYWWVGVGGGLISRLGSRVGTGAIAMEAMEAMEAMGAMEGLHYC